MNPNAHAVKKSENPPWAVVVSASQGRLRLVIREKKKDKPYFESLLRALESAPWVTRVEAHPMTGSVIIYSCLSKDDLTTRMDDTGLLTISSTREKSALPVEYRKTRPQRYQSPSGASELSALAGITLLGLAAWQGARGKFLPAGLTLIFQASEFLKSWQTRPHASHFEPLSEGL